MHIIIVTHTHARAKKSQIFSIKVVVLSCSLLNWKQIENTGVNHTAADDNNNKLYMLID